MLDVVFAIFSPIFPVDCCSCSLLNCSADELLSNVKSVKMVAKKGFNKHAKIGIIKIKKQTKKNT